MRSLLLLMLLIPASAQVIEISSLKVDVFVAEEAFVRYSFTITNLIDKPVVPGIGEMRLQKVEPLKLWIIPIPLTEKRLPVDVKNLKAYSENMNFKAYAVNSEEYTTLYYEIWYPIEPKKSMNFVLEFKADLVDKGIFFDSVSIPIGSDKNIRELVVNISSDKSMSYLEPKSLQGSIPAGNLIFFTAEFSNIPLPMLPVRGYMIFWGIILIIAAVLVIKKWR